MAFSTRASQKLSTGAQLLEAKGPKPSAYQILLAQISTILLKKYDITELTLTGPITQEESTGLIEKLNSIEAEWKASINFSDYKSHHMQDPPSKLSDYDLEKQFDEFKKQGLRWNLKIYTAMESSIEEEFLLCQLKFKKIWALSFNQLLSAKTMDRIIYACKESFLGVIFFNRPEQEISDSQAKQLFAYAKTFDLKIFDLPGRNIKNETATEIAKIAVEASLIFNINDCPYYDQRRLIENHIKDIEFKGWLTHYPLDESDIERLTQRLTNSPKTNIKFNLHIGSYIHPKWATFFTQVLTSTTNVTELIIPNTPTINDEVTLAIMQALGSNTTIKSLTINCSLSEQSIAALASSLEKNKTLSEMTFSAAQPPGHMKKIVTALTGHPTLTSLDLRYGGHGYYREISFKMLLIRTKKLEKLNLANARLDDFAIFTIAKGLEQNETLTELNLTNHALSDDGLTHLFSALEKNQHLTRLILSASFPSYQKLTESLKLNKSLIDVQVETYLSGNPHSRTFVLSGYLDTLERNRKLANFRRQEWHLENRQIYAEAAIVFFQAARQNHRCLQNFVWTEKILSYLLPNEPEILAQGNKCLRLIQRNLDSREWKSTLDLKKGGSQRIFQRWAGPSTTFKQPKLKPLRRTLAAPVVDEKKEHTEDKHIESTATSLIDIGKITKFIDKLLVDLEALSPYRKNCFFRFFRVNAVNRIPKENLARSLAQYQKEIDSGNAESIIEKISKDIETYRRILVVNQGNKTGQSRYLRALNDFLSKEPLPTTQVQHLEISIGH